MKRALPFVLVLALLIAVPAVSQDEEKTIADRVVELEETVAQQQEALKKLDAFVAAEKERAKELGRQLDAAEKQGFLYPAPHTDAKKSLIKGLRALIGPDEKKAKK